VSLEWEFQSSCWWLCSQYILVTINCMGIILPRLPSWPRELPQAEKGHTLYSFWSNGEQVGLEECPLAKASGMGFHLWLCLGSITWMDKGYDSHHLLQKRELEERSPSFIETYNILVRMYPQIDKPNSAELPCGLLLQVHWKLKLKCPMAKNGTKQH
jgi:hypothetical protein